MRHHAFTVDLVDMRTGVMLCRAAPVRVSLPRARLRVEAADDLCAARLEGRLVGLEEAYDHPAPDEAAEPARAHAFRAAYGMTFLFTEGGVGHRVASDRPCFVGEGGARLSLFALPDEGGVALPHLLRLEGVPVLQSRAEILAHLLGRAGLACGRVRGRVDAGVRMHRLGGEGADGPQTYRLVAPRLDEDDDA